MAVLNKIAMDGRVEWSRRWPLLMCLLYRAIIFGTGCVYSLLYSCIWWRRRISDAEVRVQDCAV